MLRFIGSDLLQRLGKLRIFLRDGVRHLAGFFKFILKAVDPVTKAGKFLRVVEPCNRDRTFARDQAAKEALLETARYLGLGISNLTKGLSPEAVILAGDIARAWPLISDELRSTVAENILCSGLPSAPVFASTLGDDTRLMGALSLVLARKFASVVPA